MRRFRLNRTKYTTRQIARWLWGHHKGCRLQAVCNMLTGLCMVVLGLCSVECLRLLTDTATGARAGSLWVPATALAAILLAELLLHILTTWLQAVLGVRSQCQLQQHFYDRLLRGKWQGVERLHSGDVLNRLFGDVADIVRLLADVLPHGVVTLAQFIASFVYLYVMDRALALILIVVTPLFVILSRFYFLRMRRFARKIKDSNSALQAIIQESIQHRMVIKVMEAAPRMVGRLERRQSLLRRQVKSRARFSILAKSMVHIGFAGGYLCALVYGLFQLQAGLITVGVLMAFTQLIHRIQRPMIDMARLLPTFVGSFTSSERLMELEEQPLEVFPPAPCPLPKGEGIGIRFEDVSFRYEEGRSGRQVLRHFSHHFQPGTTTAILGPTGAGKTTLVRLILALVEPDDGHLVLHTADGQETDPSVSTRTLFSYVPQGNTLFSGTIRDNLRLGNPRATETQMAEALHTAKAEFVLSLPDGLDTRCGEGGGGLSEGQAQRIAIARAILRPCSVLLLDEATSALDIETENELLTRIKAAFPRTTILFITHRLAVAAFAEEQIHMQRPTTD